MGTMLESQEKVATFSTPVANMVTQPVRGECRSWQPRQGSDGSDMAASDDRLSSVRNPEFAKRMAQAADANPKIPELNKGRLTHIVRELKSRFDTDTGTETVRKWFAGENLPRKNAMTQLAAILEVDVGWLSHGVGADFTPQERRLREAQVEGVVHLTAGLIQIDGGHPAFVDEADPRFGDIDLVAVIRGAHYGFKIALAQQDGGEHIRFRVYHARTPRIVLGIVPKAGFCFDVLELPEDLPGNAGAGRANFREFDVHMRGDRYIVGDVELTKVESFKNRM